MKDVKYGQLNIIFEIPEDKRSEDLTTSKLMDIMVELHLERKKGQTEKNNILREKFDSKNIDFFDKVEINEYAKLYFMFKQMYWFDFKRELKKGKKLVGVGTVLREEHIKKARDTEKDYSKYIGNLWKWMIKHTYKYWKHQIDVFINKWNNDEKKQKESLHKYLNMTEEQYQKFLNDPKKYWEKNIKG